MTNYLALVQYHRDIWKLTIEKPELNRIRSRDPQLRTEKPTSEEQQFLTFLFLHITCSFELQKQNNLLNIEMLQYDIGELLRCPLIRRFWEENKIYYNRDFTEFVGGCIKTDATW